MLKQLVNKVGQFQHQSSKQLIQVSPMTRTMWTDSIDSKTLAREIESTKTGEIESTIREFPGWNETLACDSEAAVKADRVPKKDFRILQQETIEIIQKKELKGEYPFMYTSKFVDQTTFRRPSENKSL